MKVTVRRVSAMFLAVILCLMMTACGSAEADFETDSAAESIADGAGESADVKDAAADLLAGVDTEDEDEAYDETDAEAPERFAAQSDGDYMDEDADFETDDSEYEEDADSDNSSDLLSSIEDFDEIYAGAYGKEYEALLAFDWDDSSALIMIYPNDSDQIDYFNVGDLTGEIGSLQTISGFADYPFEFTITDYDDENAVIALQVGDEKDSCCKLDMVDTDYMIELCEYFGML